MKAEHLIYAFCPLCCPQQKLDSRHIAVPCLRHYEELRAREKEFK
jgi:hypothetical protein